MSTSLEIEGRTIVLERKTRLSREEIRAVSEDLHRILERLLIEDLTGSITIHTNRGGICEISFSEKS